MVGTLGVHPVAFGVIMVVNLAIGYVTPPVGADLFVAQAMTGLSLEKISKAVMPFVIAELIVLALITELPILITFLPSLLS